MLESKLISSTRHKKPIGQHLYSCLQACLCLFVFFLILPLPTHFDIFLQYYIFHVVDKSKHKILVTTELPMKQITIKIFNISYIFF